MNNDSPKFFAAIPDWLKPLLTRKVLICVMTGFTSGLPLFFLMNLLPAWLKTEQVKLTDIGLFALIQLPYTWKFLWSPFLDVFSLPLLGLRRGWMLLCQLILVGLIVLCGLFSPKISLFTIAVISLLIAFFSATLDIVIDAFRREILETNELGLGNAVHVNAYRVASLIPGSLALILAGRGYGWESVFMIVALFMLPGIAMTLLVPEPLVKVTRPSTLNAAVVEPFREFINRAGTKAACWVLAFLFFYKLGDSLCTALATPFYLEMGFTVGEIGLVAKNAGLWPSIAGGILGGLWMVRLKINQALWIFGFLQAIAVLGFVLLASLGPEPLTAVQKDILCLVAPTPEQEKLLGSSLGHLVILALVIGFEAFGVGLGTTAFVAFIASNTHRSYTATQFALFTSIAAVPRTLINSTAGWLVAYLGWVNFFVLCFILTVPGMLMLFKVAPWRGGEQNLDS